MREVVCMGALQVRCSAPLILAILLDVSHL